MPIILQTWKRADLAGAPPLYRVCQPSWTRYHPDWHYRLLDDDAVDHYAAQACPRLFDAWWHRYPKGIERADLIRYLFLFHEGGLYADLDFECLRSFEPLVAGAGGDVVLGSLSRPAHAEGIPNALLIARRPRQLFWLLVLDEVRRAADARDTVERTGPVAVGRALRAYRAGPPRAADLEVTALLGIEPATVADGGVDVQPPERLYPICWIGQQWKRRLFLRLRPHVSHERIKALFPRSYAVTYWVHGWDGP